MWALLHVFVFNKIWDFLAYKISKRHFTLKFIYEGISSNLCKNDFKNISKTVSNKDVED